VSPWSGLERTTARLAAALTSRGGRHGSLLVLTYHRVLLESDPLLPGEPDVVEFAAQMEMLAGVFNIIGLPEARERLVRRSLPPRAMCITFDDGYANNCEVALPVLRERGIPATVFVTTGFLNGGRMFNDTVIEAIRRAGAELDLTPLGLGRHELPDVAARRRAIDQVLPAIKHLDPEERQARAEHIAEIVGTRLPDDLMMTDEQVRKLADAGVEIGAHTVRHPVLTRVTPERARFELVESRRRLQAITGRSVTTFAYPNGRPVSDYDASHVALVRESGFELAVSTAPGAASPPCDLFQIPRTSPWGGASLRTALRLALSFRQRDYPCVTMEGLG
jgi:peptidoglycan/xylan/chitin deacetylase (PgdA/CDA1 family)